MKAVFSSMTVHDAEHFMDSPGTRRNEVVWAVEKLFKTSSVPGQNSYIMTGCMNNDGKGHWSDLL